MKGNGLAAVQLLAMIGAASLAVSWAEPARLAVPLTPDQRDLYAAFLDLHVSAFKKFAGSSPALINLATTITPLDLGHQLKENKGCLSGITFDRLNPARKQILTLDSTLVSGRELRLVDSVEQSAIREAIIHNAPRAIVGNTTLDANLVQLSEIAFDKTRRFAVISYAFSCGNLCGEGRMVVFEKSGNGWKEADRSCIGWIS